MIKQLLIGAGSNRNKKIYIEGGETVLENAITLDMNKDHNPDIVHNLNMFPWPFDDNELDEIHAYDVLEHLGKPGDPDSFFMVFNEMYRILRPGGRLFAIVPYWKHMWSWGDPGHVRIINEGTISFLDQDAYKEVGETARTDYRYIYKGDFRILNGSNIPEKDPCSFMFVLEKK